MLDLCMQNGKIGNLLVRSMGGVFTRIGRFKVRAREYYFEVVLSQHKCPSCGGRLRMTDQSRCSCSCGNTFDPTVVFQKSGCCGAGLIQKTFHYACSKCHKIVPSRFLFDERAFDKEYFREMMRSSRRRAKERREEIRRLLAESRSGSLPLLEKPDLASIPGLIEDLNDFIQQNATDIADFAFDTAPRFRMDEYREHILSILGWSGMLFSNMAPLIREYRRDKIWRFMTLIYMQQDCEVDITQYGNDLLVQKVHHEVDR